MTVSAGAIARLPEGAAYVARRGRTELRIERAGGGDSLRATARSDGLRRETEEIEERRTTRTEGMASTTEMTSESAEKSEHRGTSLWRDLITSGATAVASGLAITAYLEYRRRRSERK